MKLPLKPISIVLFVVLPMSLYMALCWYQFDLVWPILDKENQSAILNMALNTGTILSINIIIFIYTLISKRKVPLILFIFNLLSLNIWFLNVLLSDKFNLMEIPRWMSLFDWHVVSIGTISFINLYSYMGLVLYSIKSAEDIKLWKGAAILIFIPMFVYVGYVWIWPLFRGNTYPDSGAIITFFFIICGSYTFFLFRFLYLGFQRWTWVNKLNQTFGIFIIAIVLPGFCFSIYFSNIDILGEAFGLFSKTSVILLGINAILLIINIRFKHNVHLLLFAGRSSTFTVVIYYFLVLLPFLHIALLALIALFFGILLLAPAILAFLQSKILYEDYKYLREKYSRKSLLLVFVSSLFLIPLLITLEFKRERICLDEALEYIEYPDLNKHYEINTSELKSTLTRIKEISNTSNRNNTPNYPFISAYHDFIVFDNMMLSRNRIDKLKQVYFNEINQRSETDLPTNSLIHSYKVKSQYDAKQQAWVSMVELTVGVEQGRGSLFTTDFKLPKGAWVSNYFLDIGKKREYGILAEKKSAEWVFRQITNENRDPGIISYLNNNTLRLSVFPCNTDRITGIEFTHYNPLTIKIEDQTIRLGDSTKSISKGIETHNYKLITSEEKKLLKNVIRKPRVHFIINNNDYAYSQPEKIKNTMQKFLIKNRIPLTDGHTASLPNVSNQNYAWNQIPDNVAGKSKQIKGFYPVFNIRKTLTELYKNSSDFFPLIIVLNEYTSGMIMEKDFSELYMCFPDHRYFYELRSDGKLNSHQLDSLSYISIDTIDYIKPFEQVYEYKSGDIKRYINKDEGMEIVLKKMNQEIDYESLKPKHISSAIDLQATSMSETLNPKLAHENWHKMLRSSFKTGFLTPNTSFISLENQAQKNILKHKQRMAMLGEREGEFEEISRTFSEPEEWILYALILTFICLLAIRRKRLKSKLDAF